MIQQKIGVAVSIVFGSITWTHAEMGMKVISFLVTLVAAGSTIYLNQRKIKNDKNEQINRPD
jgi:hypothetical protein